MESWRPGAICVAIRQVNRAQLDSVVLDNLCDALARGRLCLAEMALLEPAELEAMYGIGLARMDAGRTDEAVTILQALVSLYAYCAKYWRGLAWALHTATLAEAALLAYRIALHLEPDHIPTLGYLGELTLFCGMPEQAQPLLERVANSGHPEAAPRAKLLLGAPAPPPLPDVAPVATFLRSDDTTDVFELAGGRPLPMPHLGSDTAPLTFPDAREVTGKIFLADHGTDETVGPVTNTAIVRRPGHPRPMPKEGSATDTGVVDRDVRPQGAPSAAWNFIDWFASAARRRRAAAPLLDDEQTSPMAGRPVRGPQ